jgi:hypothetical protein
LFIFVLILAGVLGSAVGYWAYLQVPPATVQLHLEPSGGNYVITWMANVTRDADSVTMRINDSEPTAVSAADKAAGQVIIPGRPGGVKVEIIAHHTLRDTRGIVRYINGQPK